jgi:hypothetical protein
MIVDLILKKLHSLCYAYHTLKPFSAGKERRREKNCFAGVCIGDGGAERFMCQTGLQEDYE